MEIIPKPPTESMLKNLVLQVKANPSFKEMIEQKIEKFSLPYRIEIHPDGSATLENIFTPGEEYLNRFITISASMIAMKERAKKMSYCEYPVLITGETGTGKEIIAKSMIANRIGLIQAINCAGLPSELIESELFGHVKGSFTGANSDKIGLIESAKDGICFLDEINSLPMSAQGKLLRAIQEKKIRRVGSNITTDINCKFVFASNKDIKKMCEGDSPTFRLDLYARISTLELHIIPLSERIGDCIEIVKSMQGGDRFLEKYSERLMQRELDLSLNVRSLEKHVIRYNILGEI